MNCVTCNERLSFRWTDTHGIGVCVECGTPYRVLHYEGETLVEKEPEPALYPSGLVLAKRYWGEIGKKVFPGCYDVIGISRRRGNCTYSGATAEEIREFDEWYACNSENCEPS